MRLNNITISNFRRFERLEISLKEKLVILVAGNGCGKTTVLDAIAISLGSYVGEFEAGKADPIKKDDVRVIMRVDTEERIPQFPAEVSSAIEVETHHPNTRLILTKRVLPGPKKNTSTKESKALRDYANNLIGEVMDQKDPLLPALAFYGTGRLWTSHRETEKRWLLTQDRTAGYDQCLSSRSNFQQLQQWMKRASLAKHQRIEENRDFSNRLNLVIEAVELAVNQVLASQGLSGFRYDLTLDELCIIDKDGILFPVRQLSDGFQVMTALVADLAYRCARLNPHLGNSAPALTPGIVLIDEIELHLHPAWQQVVVGSLINAFPAIQFILTTHSPQIISTAKRESVRILEEVKDAGSGSVSCRALVPDISPYCHEAGFTLPSVFGVPERPPVAPVMEEIGRYYQLLRSSTYSTDAAKAILQKLADMGYQLTAAEERRAELLLRHFQGSREDGNKHHG